MVLGPGSRVCSYRILGKIGAGGMSTVYLARRPGAGANVALKLLRSDLRGDARMVARFMREARILARTRHPNIVEVLDHGSTRDGHPFTVLEYLDGETLRQHLDKAGRLPWNDVVELGVDLVRALSAAHAVGIVHRDVKPENCMIVFGQDGHPSLKLIDFGVAKVLHADADSCSLPHTILGTPGYMAPEQALLREVDARADVYGAGATLFELLTGHPPFDTNRAPPQVIADHLHRPPPSAFEHCPGLEAPPELDMLLRKCLARTPAHRCASARELLNELERLRDGLNLPNTLTTSRSSLDLRLGRRGILGAPGFRAGVIAGFLLSCIIVSGLAVGGQAIAASVDRCAE